MPDDNKPNKDYLAVTETKPEREARWEREAVHRRVRNAGFDPDKYEEAKAYVQQVISAVRDIVPQGDIPDDVRELFADWLMMSDDARRMAGLPTSMKAFAEAYNTPYHVVTKWKKDPDFNREWIAGGQVRDLVLEGLPDVVKNAVRIASSEKAAPGHIKLVTELAGLLMKDTPSDRELTAQVLTSARPEEHAMMMSRLVQSEQVIGEFIGWLLAPSDRPPTREEVYGRLGEALTTALVNVVSGKGRDPVGRANEREVSRAEAEGRVPIHRPFFAQDAEIVSERQDLARYAATKRPDNP